MEKQKKQRNKKILLAVLSLLLLIMLVVLFWLVKKPKIEWITEKIGNLEYTHVTNALKLEKKNGYESTYQFEVTTTEDSELKYIVAILQNNDNDSFYFNEYIRISLKKNNEYIIGSKTEGVLLSSLDGFELGNKTGYSNIAYETVKKNQKDEYELKIYLDNEAIKDAKNSYELQVKIYEADEEVKPIQITLNFENGQKAKKITINENGKYENLPTPYKTGYKFIGWYTKDGKPVTGSDYFNTIKALNLYARYQEEKYNVTINANGGTYEGNINFIKKYTDKTTIEIPKKEGYTFKGWKLEGNAKLENNVLTNITSNVTLTAEYEVNTYQLTINPNGGKWKENDENSILKIKYEETQEIEDPTRIGYTFKGWELEGNKSTLTNNNFTMGLEDSTLTAKWEKNKYLVNFNMNGANETIHSQIYTYEDELGTLPIPSKLGYDFLGWYIDDKQVTSDLKVTQDLTLEAKWTEKEYRLIIDTAGGIWKENEQSPEISDQVEYKIKYNSTKEIPDPKREDYLFAGWEFNANNTSSVMSGQTFKMGTQDTILTAKWIEDKFSYIVKHYLENIDNDEYTLMKIEAFTDVKSETVVEPELKNYEGYINPEKVKLTVSTDNDKNIVVYKYKRKSYNLSINPNGGEYEESTEIQKIENVKYESTITISNPTREGYTFAGWEIDADSDSTIIGNNFKMGSKDSTLTAKWDANTYKITFDANGADSIDASTTLIKYDDKYKNLGVARKLGYTFAGWWTDPTGGTLIQNGDTVKITENTTLYAHFNIIRSILSINPNGGTLEIEGTESSDIREYKDTEYNKTITIPEPKREGYTFVRWDKVGDSSILSGNELVMGYENTTLTAVWQINHYLITLNVNGGALTDNTSSRIIDVEYGEKYYSKIAEVSRTGYTLEGWYTENTFINKVTSETQAKDNITIIAKWVANPVKLTIDLCDGSEPEVRNLKFEDITNVAIPTREGYTFKGWELSSGNSQVNQSATDDTLVIMGTEDTVIKAKWKANKYTLTLEANGGTLTSTNIEVTYDSEYGTLEVPVKTGYTFKGWYDSLTFENEITNTTKVKKTEDHTIYAKWEVNKYTLTFNYDGGTGSETTREVTYDKSIGILPTTEKEGNTFLGWYIEDKIITDGYIYKIDSDKEIVAKWSVNQYSLTINPNGGTYAGSVATTTQIVDYGSQIALEVPTKMGYSFNGWDITGEATIDSNNLTMGASDVELTAKWKLATGKLTIKYEDGITEDKEYQDLAYLDTVEVEDPEREGYTFTGWTLEGENSKLNDKTFTMGTKDSTLTATWVANTYTYIVKHYKQTIDGTGYTLIEADTEENEGLYGTEITPEVRSYEGFTAPEKITKTISTTDNEIEYKYARNKHKITIDPNGGQYHSQADIIEKEAYYDELVGLEIPTREGYTFKDWTIIGGIFTDNSIRMQDEDITLVANYTPNMHVLMYNTNGGGINIGGKVVIYDQVYGELPVPVKAGYEFKGWYLDSNFTNKVEETDIVKITEHITLYAKWEKCAYKLQIDPNDGEWEGTSNITTVGINMGDVKTIKAPTKYGYKFTGWTFTGEGTMSSLVSDATYTAAEGNASLVANWAPKTFTLYYNTNGGTIDPLTKTITFNEKYGTLTTPIRNGYHFDGWFTELTAGEEVTVEEILTNEGNVHIFAHWTIESYELTVKPNGGEWTDGENTFITDQIFILEYLSTKEIKVPTREGYRFNTWSFEGNPNGSSLTSTIADATFTMGYSNIAIKAEWAAKEYTIIFDGNGGTSTESNKTVIYDSTYGELPTATREGYDFKGWYTAKDGGEQITSSSIVKITKSQELYAHWEAKQYTVTYNPNGGTVTNSTETVTFGKEYGTLETPIRRGYVFDGWYLDSELTNKITNATKVSNANDHIIYAKWTANNYTITFDLAGGTSSVTTKKVTYDEPYGILPTPTREGYTFSGWYTLAQEGAKITETTIVDIVEDTILYAHWNATKYTVTFNTNGGNSVNDIQVTYHSTYENLPTPTRTGYAFLGWYSDSALTNKIEKTTQVTTASNHILYAKWQVNTYRVVFDSDGGTTCASKEVVYGEEYGTLEYPTKEGYTFIGWYIDQSCSSQVFKSTIVTKASDHTLYAGWVSNLDVSNTNWTELPTTANSTLTGKYKVSSSKTITGSTGQNALKVSGTATIYIPKGVTLTVKGGNGSYTTAGGAGIYVPSSATLIVLGEGTLNATGGKAGSAGSGGPGGNGSIGETSKSSNSDDYMYSGSGGSGGNGGGGAGAGIGGSGGSGGYGGSGGSGRTAYAEKSSSAKLNGYSGSNGSSGSSGTTMGTVYVLGTVTVNATGGSSGSTASGGSAGSYASYAWKNRYYAGGGGGGGSGAPGQSATAIGGGAGGGYGGGGGGSGNTAYSSGSKNKGYYSGGKGGSGYNSGISAYTGTVDNTSGGSGGSSGSYGSSGGSGTLYKASTATINGTSRSYNTTNTHSSLQYTVVLNGQLADTAGTRSVTVLYGGTLPSITIPTKEGYTFGGYFTGVNGLGTQYYSSKGSATIAAYYKPYNITLYAYWKENS